MYNNEKGQEIKEKLIKKEKVRANKRIQLKIKKKNIVSIKISSKNKDYPLKTNRVYIRACKNNDYPLKTNRVYIRTCKNNLNFNDLNIIFILILIINYKNKQYSL